MKKNNMLSLVFGSALIAMFATSCDEDLTSTPLSIDYLDSVTVRIYPKTDLDLTSAGNESAPAGTSVTITIPYSQYSTTGTGGGSNSSIVVGDTVNANGFAEFTVPVDDNGVNATVSVDGFEFDQVQADGSTKASWYNFTPITYALILGGKSIYSQSLATITAIDESSTLLPATLVGNVTGEFNNQSPGKESAPEGTVVTITKVDGAEQFETETTLDANGQFSIEVEVNRNGGDSFEVTVKAFNAEQVQTAGASPATINVEFASTTVDYDDIVPGQTKIQNIVLADPTSTDTETSVELITISGTIYSETNEDQETASREQLANTTLTLYTIFEGEDEDETTTVQWSEEVTTDANGKYTVDIPVDNNIYLSSTAHVDRTLDTGEVDGDLNPIYETTTFRLDIARVADGADTDDTDDAFLLTGGLTFDQGGIDIGTEAGADQFASDWVEVTQP
ncbi:hypothetical protein SAMN04488029_3680 [Reichenbachiella faecimaris]|uniref:Carboxypeptidase regulatory-like domain-containing protein n=1 Tax=Reichenbachiella faecimaris TaxID=692418 RepID=A0A1W2GNM8_REIFA|nr:hypothetical protein [Reichenbachiella faecimaris]SMD38201.1 hypothetical protein SAMN04488029_3680 [Reichenbachiella faecimaris]